VHEGELRSSPVVAVDVVDVVDVVPAAVSRSFLGVARPALAGDL
jgi:hypothetical protein